MALISIHRISLGISDEMGDTAHRHVAKYMREANLAAKDLFLYVIPHSEELSVTSRVLPIGSNYMIELPDDFIYEVKVGVCSNGRIAVLGLSDDLCGTSNNQNCPCTEATQEINDICSGTCTGDMYTFYNTWRNGGYLGELYGLKGGQNCLGYYKIDRTNNRIILSSELPGREIILEYKADPTLNGIGLVPSEAELAIREFVLWRLKINSQPNVARVHREEYITEYNKLKKLYSSISAQDWRDIFLRATTSTIQR